MPEPIARRRRATPAGAQPRLAVGLMAGTSLDGVDAALVEISGPVEQPHLELVAFLTVPYSGSVRRRLLNVADAQPVEAEEISELNFLLGELFAETALKVCRLARIPPERLEVIGSHGQTVFHQGRLKRREGGRAHGSRRQSTPSPASTLQIAEPAVIAARTGIKVVADFRTADIAAGGHGAPLVPLVDYLLLHDARLSTVALNIGGIANVTVIPPRASIADVFGFDTGPGNMVIDALVGRFSKGKMTCDVDGRIAAQGKVLERCLQRALDTPFFREQPPRSAGREQFGSRFLARYFPPRASFRDLVRTATELTARSIAQALEHFVFPRVVVDRVVVSGGGSHNRFLMDRLEAVVPSLRFHLSNECGLPADAKEAIAFAMLAERTLAGLPGNLPRVTGARRAVVLGKVVRP